MVCVRASGSGSTVAGAMDRVAHPSGQGDGEQAGRRKGEASGWMSEANAWHGRSPGAA